MRKTKMKQRVMAVLLSLCMLGTSFQLGGFQVTAADADEEPILTIACLSDLHNQMELITGDVDSVRLRGTVPATVQAIHEQEDIDMMVLCGDYTSDASNVPEVNWERIRELMVDATRSAFPDDATYTPVIWVDGNHDYEISREYDAGDYYTYPMKDDIGELPADDCFYETTSDGKHSLLAAFYYELFGFDFLCLNTGTFFYDHPNGAYDSYNSYRYSDNAVAWVKDKLAEIYADNPEKTVFFVTHVPFDDSNSINKGKGMDETYASTIELKKTLAQYPNLIHLYGHDHGGDSAYIRSTTAQRVTQYDTDGNKITGEKTSPGWKITAAEGGYTIQNTVSGGYLGFDENTAMLEEAAVCQIEKVAGTENGYYITLSNAGTTPNLYFSTSSKTFSGNAATCELAIYEQTVSENGVYSFAPATEITDEGTYAIVKEYEGEIYALTNETNGSTGSSARLVPTIVELSEEGITWEDTTSGAAPSFITSFVGSMRYYSSSIDGGSSINTSKVVQALMVYVYKDRVELQMKNYGSYEYYDQPYPGNTSIIIHKNLLPYITYRKVYSNNAFTADLSALVEEMDTVSLKGYSAESIKAFAAALAEAKALLKQDGADIEQEQVEQVMSALKEAKDSLMLAEEPATETPPTEIPPAADTDNKVETPPTEAPATVTPVVNVPKLTKPVLKAVAAKTKKVKLSWKKQSNATGYIIQMKTGKGAYKNVGKVTKNTKIKLTTKKLKKGTYKFRMRSYATYTDANNAKKTVRSKFSKVVTVKIK